MSYTYKVIEQKQKTLFKGKLRASDLEALINQNANEGWILDRIIGGETYSFLTGGKDVFLVIFRKENH